MKRVITRVCKRCGNSFILNNNTSGNRKYCPVCRSKRFGNDIITLGVIEGFDAAHLLKLPYNSKCKNLHGHSWKVDVKVSSIGLTEYGMVMDFSILKGIVKNVLEIFDHHFINDIVEQPTSENISKFLFKVLRKKIDNYEGGVILSEVIVWETPTSSCTYQRGEYIHDLRSESKKEVWKNFTPEEIKQMTLKCAKTKKENNSAYRPFGELNIMKRVEVKEKMLRSMIKSVQRKPNKLEQKFINLFKQNNIPFEYNGTGEVIIHGKIPDFVNIQKKKLIEIFGNFWHSDNNKWYNTSNNEKERIEFFKNQGYDCLVIWEKELENKKEIIKKIKKWVSDN